MYQITYTKTAQKDLVLLARKAPSALPKLKKLLAELQEHPRTGTGQVEQLKGMARETWSRRINREHRLVYEIHDETIMVIVISSFGHYS